MNALEIAAECQKELNNPHGMGKIGLLFKGQNARGTHKRLFGRHGGPLGIVVDEMDGGVYVFFDAAEVLAWLITHDGAPDGAIAEDRERIETAGKSKR